MSLNLQSHTISQRKSLKLKGTKTSVTKNQILISTGIVSLDAVLDGGIPIGTVALVEEENYGRNAYLITKHFIAEGIVCDHSILIADVERKPGTIANDLPKPIHEDSFQPTDIVAEDFKIAWRYSQNPIYDSKPYHTSISFGHTFDMSAKLPVNELQNIRCWPVDKSQGTSYSELLEHINTVIIKGGFSTKIPVEQRHVLRITISNLFSPIWDFNDMDVVTFLYKLRILVRSSYATCLITTQAHVIDDVTKCRIEHFVDTVLIFKPMELSSCADYNGKLIIGKLASFNTFLYEPLSVDWATKLTRKKLCIEKLHLPPCLNTGDDNENIHTKQLSCASTTSVLNF
ncbi:elongator complex protein 4 [Rhopalosiphum padi]|uniref:elongator complex protein 4 n=1 Tax=Rhopalosiphum padi TaxID=40932 RepID=UPI00298DE973|nr:elongator complex protein 4 [Rhopalosiphum padi]